MVYRRRDILGHDMTVIISMLRGVMLGAQQDQDGPLRGALWSPEIAGCADLRAERDVISGARSGTSRGSPANRGRN